MKSLILILTFFVAQTISAQEKKTPFVFDDGTTQIKVGGFVQAGIASDFGGAINNYDFFVARLPVPEDWRQQNRFAFDASASRINLAVTHKSASIGDVKFFVETDFRSEGNVLRIRHAYISVLGFTAGQTWSFMVDGDAMAPTVDVPGVNARIWFRTPLIGYGYQFGERFSAGISVEMPNARFTPDVSGSHIVSVAQNVPDIPAFVQFKASSGHIRISGVVRHIKYGNSTTENIRTKYGLGGQLSGSVKPFSALALYGQGIYGKGVARYINDLGVLSLDLLSHITNPDDADVPTMWSASAGVRANISSKLYATSNFGFVRLDKNDDLLKDSDFKQSRYFSATLFWRAYQNLLFAAEYLYGKRTNINSDWGDVNRMQAMLRYSF